MEGELFNLGIIFLVAILGGVLAYKFKQPAVIGLIIMGALIGPHMLGLITDNNLMNMLIEFGAILSLFVLGMEFSLKKLLKIGTKSIMVALFKVGIMFFIGFMLMIVMGFNITTGVFLGVALSFSSTVIITSLLRQKNYISKKEVPMLVAVLILEDIFGVIALTLFAASKGSSIVQGFENILIGILLLVVVYLIASKFAERAMKWARKNTHDDILIFLSLGLCAAFSYLAFLLHLSPSIGAFLAGSILSNFSESRAFEQTVKPHSYLFTTLFFIAMGMLVDVKSLLAHWDVLLILIVVSIGGMFIAMGLVSKLFAGVSRDSMVFSSIMMLPPGIFSLLVAKESALFGVQIDLVAVIAALILVHTIVLNIMTANLSKVTELLRKKDNKTVYGISEFFSNLFTELDIESRFTRVLKSKTQAFFFKGILIMLCLVAVKKIVAWGTLGIIGGVILGIIGLYGILLAYMDFSHAYTCVVKIIGDLEAGARIMQIKRGIKVLSVGTILLIIGFFSPFLLFIIGLPAVYAWICVGLVGIGVLCYIIAAQSLNALTFKYKYAIGTFKKYAR